MNSRKIVEPILNSALEILPLTLFMVASFYISLNTAFRIGAVTHVICFLFYFFKFRCSPPYMLIITGVIMALFFMASVFPPLNRMQHEYSSVLCEILLVAIFSFLNILRTYISGKIKNRQERIMRASVAARLDEFFYVSRVIRNLLITHLLIILIYELTPEYYHSSYAEVVIIPGLLFIFIMSAIVIEYIRLSILNRKMSSEDWLPIVNESGGVIGKIAFSISQTSNQQYLHPLVRIALIHKGLLYLSDRSSHYTLNPNKIDYPFEKLVFYNQTLEDVIGNTLKKGCGNDELPVRFVFRYLLKNETSNRLIYLYTCRINDEALMNSLMLDNGKLWTEKQIEENIGKGVFSECFEKEYEILRDTVLMAEKM